MWLFSDPLADTPSDAEHWQRCADSYALVIAVAGHRGVNPLLLAALRETEEKYRRWARELEMIHSSPVIPAQVRRY